MQSFVIEGGRPLSGTVRAAGNKNGALPILAATILASAPVVLSNVPRIRDVETMVELLADLGADAAWTGPNEVTVDSAGVANRVRDDRLAGGRDARRIGKRQIALVSERLGRLDLQLSGVRRAVIDKCTCAQIVGYRRGHATLRSHRDGQYGI
jgi:UDP-N-acetylglucosamine enolpyruvyl transferase